MFAKKFAAFVLAAMLAPLAFAEIALDDAKRDGLIGEDASGYVAAVAAAPTKEVRALVKSVNDKRRAEYERIAEDNDIELSDVEQLAGRKAIEKTESGHYIRLPGSSWQPK